ncbi:MAG: tRNA (N(6)-L-threonylcarbamoyladenosine(37)-C(2))-methylthiotransferase MtaB, partial [Chloroflexi bacterium]|nr:tRNA (N(6)-L-threonylcarbamoyladenosine(37)-C(2))-methylthiotransferase MtaB [Chloroflexota bacterium]
MALLRSNPPVDAFGRPTVAIATLGCKVNQAESDGYAQEFADAGFQIVPAGRPADVAVINSCTVTNVGDQKSRQLIQRLHKANPDSLLAVTGCYAAVAPLQVEQATGADIVAGLEQKSSLVALVQERLIERGTLPARWTFSQPQNQPMARAVPRTRLNVKVQDGCNDFCTYCIVPFSRGRARSVPVKEVLGRVERAVSDGYQEVVLTGVNMTTYGRETGVSFGSLLETILQRTAIRRVRLSSIEPYKFDTAWLSLWDSGRLCRHLHLPLQSGCDDTLQRMRRRYSGAWFSRLVEDIRAAVPDMAIWTDVIAGFPGETDSEFEDSFEFVRSQRFAGIHVFRFSPRNGTRAATMDGRVMERVKKERSERLLSLSRQGKQAFAERLLGSTVEVLFEESGSGLSSNYVRVAAAGGRPNTFGNVRVAALANDGVEGTL